MNLKMSLLQIAIGISIRPSPEEKASRFLPFTGFNRIGDFILHGEDFPVLSQHLRPSYDDHLAENIGASQGIWIMNTDRKDGGVIWRKEVICGRMPRISKKSSGAQTAAYAQAPILPI